LLGVAVNRCTIEAVCADLVGAPDPQTIRGYLNEQLCVEELPELERRLNAALAAELPPRVRRHAQEVAIDYHDRPYYGKTAQAEGLWVRGHAKDGTTRFYRVATAYLILNGLRLTLALHFVLPTDDTVRVLDTVLKRVQTLGLRVTCLLLDKGAGLLDPPAPPRPHCLSDPGHDGRDARPVPGAPQLLHDPHLHRGARPGVDSSGGGLPRVHHGPPHPPAATAG